VEITLRRRWFSERSTIGTLVAGDRSWYTLEDPVRSGPKVPGATAIPAGRYRVLVTWSPRFQRRLPILLEVPQFSGIRIHTGNSPDDTQGCILVGRDRAPDWIGESRAALAEMQPILEAALESGEVWITITDEPVSS
jgi:hypothetical protein